MTYEIIASNLRALAKSDKAQQYQRFFKTAKGEYGYGDIFIGVTVPEIRKIAKKYRQLPIASVRKLIRSKIHEERLLGLIILTYQYDDFVKRKDSAGQKRIYNVYVSLFKYINNWDLVDVTCPRVVGQYLLDKDRSVLKEWASSNDLWTKRIAIISVLWFIRKDDLKSVLPISKILLQDKHDLIHKAVGWVLREAWKKDAPLIEDFIKKNLADMPRTMLRYAIEKMPEAKRQKFLKGNI